MSRDERQAELVETHRAIHDAELPYVLIGGWAVSAFQARFTADIDMVIPGEALDAYHDLLTDLGYTKEQDADIARIYEGRMVGYEKAVGDNTIAFETMVDALRCRQTNAEWSYGYIRSHSTVASLAIAEELTARIPEPALLFAMKLHSGRRADTRDLVVIGAHADFDRIGEHLHRGDPAALRDQIDRVLDRITDEDFEDAFKGVFQQRTLPELDLAAVAEVLRSHRRILDDDT